MIYLQSLWLQGTARFLLNPMRENSIQGCCCFSWKIVTTSYQDGTSFLKMHILYIYTQQTSIQMHRQDSEKNRKLGWPLSQSIAQHNSKGFTTTTMYKSHSKISHSPFQFLRQTRKEFMGSDVRCFASNALYDGKWTQTLMLQTAEAMLI